MKTPNTNAAWNSHAKARQSFRFSVELRAKGDARATTYQKLAALYWRMAKAQTV